MELNQMIDVNQTYVLKDNDNETCEIIEVVGNEVAYSYMAEVPNIIDGSGDLKRFTDVMPVNEFLELWEVASEH